MKTSIAFRVDASLEIGTGHVMRCLTLADGLRKNGAKCIFLCRPQLGHLMDLIQQRGHDVIALPELIDEYYLPGNAHAHASWLGTDWFTDAEDTCDALKFTTVDWIVVDHYALDQNWEAVLRRNCKNLMVIDDLADRPHNCDLLLDQNLGRSIGDYFGLVSKDAVLLIGPQFALLRPEFYLYRKESLARRESPKFKQLLISMGGVDKENITEQVLLALESCELPENLQITVVMGLKAPWLDRVNAQAARMRRPTRVLVGVSDMAKLMAQSDLAIGAAGGTSWERCCLGLPSIQLVLADNQKSIALALASVGAAISIELNELSMRLKYLFKSNRIEKNLHEISCAARAIADGCGVVSVVKYMLGN